MASFYPHGKANISMYLFYGFVRFYPRRQACIVRNCVWSMPMAMKFSGVQHLDVFLKEKEGELREVGHQAVWSLSSCKPGFGVDQLRDDSNESYWQSDGPQPHLINIQFHRKTTIYDVCLYGDYKADESYTPNRLSIRAGNHFNELVEMEVVDLSEPQGWISIPLTDVNDKPIRTFMIQIAVLSNHQNGRDTHIRRIKVRSPVQNLAFGKIPNFTTLSIRAENHFNDLVEMEVLELSEPQGWVSIPLTDVNDKPIWIRVKDS